MTDNRGSEWLKWDLHVHSPKSWKNNKGYSGCTDDDFVRAVKRSGLDVIGLTNYFNFAAGEIDGEECLKLKLEEAGIVVFSNLEIRLSFQNEKSDLCDYHILFSPNTPSEKIKNFLAQLNVHCEDCQIRKGNDLTEQQLRGNKLYIDFVDLRNAINDEALDIKKYVMTGFLSDGKGESRSASVSDHICNNSDFVLHASTSKSKIQRDYEFWTKDVNKPIKPIFQSSDAHALQDIGKNFT